MKMYPGGPGHYVFSSFTSVLLVVGGSGISFALATIQELMQQDEEGKSRVQHIELLWSVRDPCESQTILFYEVLTLWVSLSRTHVAHSCLRSPRTAGDNHSHRNALHSRFHQTIQIQ